MPMLNQGISCTKSGPPTQIYRESNKISHIINKWDTSPALRITSLICKKQKCPHSNGYNLQTKIYTWKSNYIDTDIKIMN